MNHHGAVLQGGYRPSGGSGGGQLPHPDRKSRPHRPVFRTLQVGDTVVPFEDLVEVSGEGIMDIDVYLGIGEE